MLDRLRTVILNRASMGIRWHRPRGEEVIQTRRLYQGETQGVIFQESLQAPDGGRRGQINRRPLSGESGQHLLVLSFSAFGPISGHRPSLSTLLWYCRAGAAMVRGAKTTFAAPRIVSARKSFPIAYQPSFNEDGRDICVIDKTLSDDAAPVRWLRPSVARGATAYLDATHPLAVDKSAQCLACVVITAAALYFGRIDPTQTDIPARPAVRAKLDIVPIDDALYQAEKFSGIAGRDAGDEKYQNGRNGWCCATTTLTIFHPGMTDRARISPGGGDRPKSEDQPHAKQIAHAPQPTMWSANKEREPGQSPAMPNGRCRMHGGLVRLRQRFVR
jgi:hypothetical protein